MHCIQPDPCVSFDLNQLVLPVFDLNQACFRPEPAGFRPELLVFDLNPSSFDLTLLVPGRVEGDLPYDRSRSDKWEQHCRLHIRMKNPYCSHWKKLRSHQNFA